MAGLALAVLAGVGACSDSGDGGDEPAPDEACAPLPLEDGCAAGCPSSPDDVELFCPGGFKTTTRRSTECGGAYVMRNYGLGYTGYYFDEKGELVGIVAATDAGEGCTDGNGPITTTFGKTCRATGEPVDLCEGSAGSGGDGAGGNSQ